MSTIYGSFRKHGINVEVLGKAIGSGTQSIAIEPKKEFTQEGLHLENPILLTSLEGFKFSLIKKIFGKKMVALVESEYLSGEADLILSQLKEGGLSFFYMEKMDKTIISTDMVNVLHNFSKEYWEEDFHSKEDFSWVEEDLRLRFTMRDRLFTDQDQMVLSAIMHSLNAVQQCEFKDRFKLDLHCEQFLTFKGRIYCSDPILFDSDMFEDNGSEATGKALAKTGE